MREWSLLWNYVVDNVKWARMFFLSDGSANVEFVEMAREIITWTQSWWS